MASGRSSNWTARISRYSDDFACMQADDNFATSILCNMYNDDKFCDVSLYGVPPPGVELSSLRPIRSYKAVLAHASKHLYELFTADGYLDSHQAEYNIEIVDHETLRRIVDFIHTGKVMLEMLNDVEIVLKLLIGAKYLLMENVSDGCENYLAEQINLVGCISAWCFARKYSCLLLMEATSTCIASKYLDALPKHGEFLCMPYADLAKLFMSEPVIAASGEQRYYAAIAWLEFTGNADSRVKYVYDVMNMIPLASGLLPRETILQANENKMLREHAPAMLWDAGMNALKMQTKQVVVQNDFMDTSFKIRVQFSHWEHEDLLIDCTAHHTVGELKTLIEGSCGTRFDCLGLNWDGDDFYSDDFTLADHGITDSILIYASC